MIKRCAAGARQARASRRTLTRWLCTMVAVVLLVLGPGIGVAGATTHAVTFNNFSGQPIRLAIMEYDPSMCPSEEYWYVHGWLQLLPDANATFYTDHYVFWYYAERADGSAGDGTFAIYVTNASFERCRLSGAAEAQPGADYYLVEMRKIDLVDTGDFTMNLR